MDSVGLGFLVIGDDLFASPTIGAVLTPSADVQSWDLVCDAVDVAIGDVAVVLAALLAVEGLDVIPQLALRACSYRRSLLPDERSWSIVFVLKERYSIFRIPGRTNSLGIAGKAS